MSSKASRRRCRAPLAKGQLWAGAPFFFLQFGRFCEHPYGTQCTRTHPRQRPKRRYALLQNRSLWPGRRCKGDKIWLELCQKHLIARSITSREEP